MGKEIGEQRNYSEKVATKIDEEVFRFLDGARKIAADICRKFRGKLDEIAAKLLKQETIEQEEFAKLVIDILPPEKRAAEAK